MNRLATFTLLVLCAGALAAPASASPSASPVSDALSRPAVASHQAARSVLLGAAQTGQRLVAVGERGIVLLSDDQGLSWQQASVPVSVSLTAVRFNGAHGIAVGHGGSVLTSDDSGSTWKRRLDGRQAAQVAVQAAQASGDAMALKAAQQLATDGPDKPFLDVLAFDAKRALVVGAYGLAFATEDGGKTWASWMNRLDNPKGLHLYAARARGEHIVIAGEQGVLLRSDDGGRQFTRLPTPYKGSFFTLEMPSDDEIIVAGLRGNAWRSTDAGQTWSQIDVPMPVSITGSALRADGAVVLVNQAGMVFSSRDGLLTALPMPAKAPALPPLNGVLPRASGALLLLSIQGAITLPSQALP